MHMQYNVSGGVGRANGAQSRIFATSFRISPRSIWRSGPSPFGLLTFQGRVWVEISNRFINYFGI